MASSVKQTPATRWLGLNWQLNPTFGWGVLGLNLALQAEQDGRLTPVPFVPTIHLEAVPPQYHPLVERILAREKSAADLLSQHPGKRCCCDFPVVHTLGNRLLSNDAAERVVGSVNLAIIFLEDTHLPGPALAVAKRFNLILAGSSWVEEVLRRNGIRHVKTFLQGIDHSIFRPAGKIRSDGAAFVVFSGGKLEYRKGQDIVVAAFRKFRQRHPEAVLATAWHNHWPKSMQGIEHKGHVAGVPAVGADGQIDLTAWLEQNGVPRNASYNLGSVPNHLMPKIHVQVDAAVFPNRCEGGTNLMAMECLAMGLPTILSANTGHLDLIDEGHCFPLRQQGSVDVVPPYAGTDGWGESDVEEVVDALERVHRDRAEAEKRGAAAVQFMRDWSWRRRLEELIAHLQRSG